MGIFNKIAQYKQYKKGISHCTFNPEGPGVVRIHLVPPAFRLFSSDSYIVILNGYYLLPIGYSWAVVLSAFMEQANKYDARPVSEAEEAGIFRQTVKSVRKAYPLLSEKYIEADLQEILGILFSVARGEISREAMGHFSLRAYAPAMTAPHRMDLMVSAMTDNDGKWNCNQKCVFCYAAGQCMSGTKELNTAEWKTILDRLYDARIPMVTFTGGEPTIRNDLVELIRHAHRFVTRLNTNGIKLTKELCLQLKSASLDSVQITLYSSDESIHNSLVGGAHFSETVKGIENAVNAGLDVSVNTPLCKANADYLSTLKLVSSLGVRFVTASGLICTGSAEECHSDADLSKNELTEIIRNAKSYCDENAMEIDFTSPGLIDADALYDMGMNVPSCGAALSNMAVCPDGSVIPCQSWLTDEYVAGNALYDDFSVIWSNEKCVRLRNMSEDECLHCPFRKRGER